MSRTDTMAFIQKMMQAKRMEAEALLLLVPEKAREHMTVIGKELRSMVMECLAEVFIKPDEAEPDKVKREPVHEVRKVDIG